MRRFLSLAAIVTLLVAFAVGCSSCDVHVATTTDRNGSPGNAPSGTSAQQTATTSRNLSRDESLGGHTLARHIGKSDDELRERLQHERVSAASAYTDLASAERAVGAAIAANEQRIHEWTTKSGGHPNLALDYESPEPIGRTLRRGQASSTPCSHALVVLKWRPPSDYFVLTSYPECH
jgi:hypothetical protein